MIPEFDVIVIGAGASGMMAAAYAAKGGVDVLVLEKNEKVGRKVAITGKGRCNVTNLCDRDAFFDSVKHNGRFLYSSFARFDDKATMAYMEEQGVELKVERGNRVFPVSDNAFDIVDALKKGMRDAGAQLRVDSAVDSLLIEEGAVVGVRCADGRRYRAKSVIVACGGASYPTTGSTGDGFELAKQAGHTVMEPRPSLCGFETRDFWTGKWAGLTLKNITLNASYKGKKIYSELGELLFTHRGISGPLVLTLSAVIEKQPLEDITCTIDLKSALSREQIDARLLRLIEENPKKQVVSIIEKLLPQNMAAPFAQMCGIPHDLTTSQLTRVQREAIIDNLKAFPVHLLDFMPLDEAIVTRGGVKVGEVDPSLMASKKTAGLFFCGEVLDVDAKTGGFNLQIAFTTGAAAGKAAAEHARN